MSQDKELMHATVLIIFRYTEMLRVRGESHEGGLVSNWMKKENLVGELYVNLGF